MGIAITKQKGGVRETTTSINLWRGLAMQDHQFLRFFSLFQDEVIDFRTRRIPFI